jgi:transcriptional regulator with XRE-family HTH domain
MMKKESTGNILRTLRLERKLSQSTVAAALGISRPHLTNIEKGHDAAGKETLVAAADFYGVSLDWLTQRAGSQSPEKAQVLNEREALLLGAFRALPTTEADYLLGMVLARTSGEKN